MPEKRYFRRKICLLGDAAVGKTSLIQRYVLDKFDDKYFVTLGTKVTMKDVTVEKPEKDEVVNLTLMIWDILGQREFKRLQTSFYKGSNGTIVVADFTRKETLDHIPEWILALFNTAGKVPVLLLINKSDLTNQAAYGEEEIVSLAEKYNTQYLFTSAKTGDNVEEAFVRMSQMLLQHDGKGKDKDTSSAPNQQSGSGKEDRVSGKSTEKQSS
ncbi:MAG: GTP-binding protein [Thermoplasmata archaeon]|nr:MAG: GTP-binding protein [Thermoplasmata archaeon]